MAKNLTFYRGATQTFNARIRPIELEPGDIVYFTVKANYDDDMTDSSALIKKDVTASIAGDTISFELTPQETNILPGRYVYDIIANFTDNGRVPILNGKLKITPAVTLRGIE